MFQLATVVLLAGSLVANRLAAPAHVPIGLVVVVGLVAIARLARLDAAELGLTRWRRSAVWGGVAAAVVAAGYGVLLATGLLDDATGPESPVVAGLVVVPLGTVLPEELAFRGVLWALLRRSHGATTAIVTSSVLFGLWHVLPALGGGAANEAVGGGTAARVVGTVLLTTAAGFVLTWLRTRSGLLAPAIAHWATNGLGVLAVELA